MASFFIVYDQRCYCDLLFANTVKINLESIPVVWHIVLMSIEPVETNPCRIIIIKNIKLHVGGCQGRSYVVVKVFWVVARMLLCGCLIVLGGY